MKKVVLLVVILSASAMFAQKRGEDRHSKDHKMMGGKEMHMLGMMDEKCKKDKKGRGRGGMMMEMTAEDEAMMKKHMVERGMSEADASRMIQLKKEMSTIMKKYMNSDTNS
ncbi:MAG: hypothetical protein ACRC9L_03805 [Brevinema sp.]